MSFQPDDLLTDGAVGAAVSALAQRNAHHLQDMDPEEQQEALATWHDLALAVLTAARAAVGEPVDVPEDAGGRAVIVMEDAGTEEIVVHASFFPQLQELDSGELLATPAQAAALELLEGMAPEEA